MKGKKEVKKKQGKNVKEILPPGIGKQPREPQTVSVVEAPGEVPQSFSVPSLCPPWPGNEAAKTHNFATAFEDDFEYVFPNSVYEFANSEIYWKWPEEIIIQNEIQSRFNTRVKRNPSIANITQKIGTSNISSSKLVEQETSIVESEKQIAVVTTKERDETPEEFEIRRQKEIEAQGKKKKIEEPQPKIVKEVVIGNIEMGKPLPAFCKWMSSQLQILKDRDWKDPNTNQGLWSRIYPQEEGIPVHNPNGKYWAKLHLFGEEKLVEIDGKVPVTRDGSLLLPRASVIRDLWPMLLSKAYFKLHSFRWKSVNPYISSPDQEIDGSFIYSITGMLPQQLSVDEIKDQEWRFLNQLLSKENWEKCSSLVSVHCPLGMTPSIPSMYDTPEEQKQEKEPEKPQQHQIVEEVPSQEQSPDISVKRTPEDPSHSERKSSEAMRKKLRTPKEIMREAAEKSLGQQGKTLPPKSASHRGCNVIQGFGYLLFEVFSNPEDFDMKKVQKKEKVKHQEEIKASLMRAKATSPARKLKRHQSPARLREYQKRKSRREKEKEERRNKLLESKKCEIYKLMRVKTAVTNIPVLNIACPFLNSEIQEAKIRMLNKDFFVNKELMELEKLMEKEDIELFDPQDSGIMEESKEEEVQEIPELVQPFDRLAGGVWLSAEDFPCAFKNLSLYHETAFFPYKLVLDDLLKDTTKPYTKKCENEVLVVEPQSGETELRIMVGFAPLIPQKLEFSPKYVTLSLQKYDFEQEQVIEWDKEIKLNTTSIEGQLVSLPADKYSFRPFVNCSPCGYVMWIASTEPVKNLSKVQYLTGVCSWSSQSFTFEHSALSKGGPHVLLKVDCSSENSSPVLFSLNTTNPNIFNYSELLLVNKNSDPLERDYQVLDIKTLDERRLTLPSESRLILVSMLPFAMPEGSVTLEVLTKEEGGLKLSPGDMLDPFEFTEKYFPNKYGIIFKEHLIVPEDVHFSMHVRMRNGGLQAQGTKAKEPPQESPPYNQRLLILEVYKEEELVFEERGFNQVYISNINLSKFGPELNMICRYDLNQWPECTQSSEETEFLNWVVRIVPNETIALIRDTRKQDYEDSIRKSWETAQPGRAESAKTSRARYLASVKRSQGHELTEQEQELLKESWEERRKLRKEVDPKKAKKDDKKAKEEKPSSSQARVKEPQQHVMEKVKDFLCHLNSERLIAKTGTQQQYVTQEDVVSTIEEPQQQKLKPEFTPPDKEKAKEELMQIKETFDQAFENYKNSRTKYLERYEARKEAISKLQTALQTPELQSLETAIEEAVACDSNFELVSSAQKTLHKLRISKLKENLYRAIQDKDLNQLEETYQEIKKHSIEHQLDLRVMNKAQKVCELAHKFRGALENLENWDLEQLKEIINSGKSLELLSQLISELETKLETYQKNKDLSELIQAKNTQEIQSVLSNTQGLDEDLVKQAQELLAQ